LTKTLHTLIIHEGITHIGYNAFANSSVNDVYLPATLVSIDIPFYECTMDSITFAGTCAEWNLVEKHNTVGVGCLGVTPAYVQCSDGRVAL
jgi:hypothetical protein